MSHIQFYDPSLEDEPPPKGFQTESALFMYHKQRALLALPMGAGKTRTALMAILYYWRDVLLHDRPEKDMAHDIIILCGKNAQPTWRGQIAQWFKPLGATVSFTYLTGTPQYRQQVWTKLLRGDFHANFNFFVCTYATFVKEAKRNPKLAAKVWDFQIIDEAQKLRNRRAETTKQVMRHVTEKTSKYLFLISGKPARRGPQDLWTLIRMVNRKWFPSYWKFVRTYCYVEDFGFGTEVFGVRNAENLRQFLKKFMIRFTKEDVEKELPEKSRYKLHVDLTPEQARIYDELVEDMVSIYSTTNGDVVLYSPSELGVGVKLRQLLVCPKILDERLGYGAGIEGIVEYVQDSEETHFVIFLPFTEAMPYIKQYLHDSGFESVVTIRGGMEPDKIDAAVEEFTVARGVALVSIEFAESFSLPSCGIGFMLGSSWNPDTNEQAEDRLRRLSSENRHLQIWYVNHDGTIDDRVFDILNKKNAAVQEVLKRPQDFKRRIL